MTEDRRTYIRNWQRTNIAKKRAEFFAGKSCVTCGSTDRLELDHIDPKLKTDHKIWSWKEARRQAEIAKCQILCNSCHKKKSTDYCREQFSGKPKLQLRKLTDKQVEEIRHKLLLDVAERKLASEYEVGKTTIHSIKTGQYYQSPTPA